MPISNIMQDLTNTVISYEQPNTLQEGVRYSQIMENIPTGDLPQPVGFPAPMTNQPKAGTSYPLPSSQQAGGDGNWEPIPAGIPVHPLGLQHLTTIDQLIIHQTVEDEVKNNYYIKNSLLQKIYTTKEENNCCIRNCCTNDRPFEMKIKDNAGNEAINLVRDLGCGDMCCCPCCLQKLEVMSPPGVPVGRVVQEWSILATKLRVENESGETVLKIIGPFFRGEYDICGCENLKNIEIELLSMNDEKVGKILIPWPGLARSHFGITFPAYLDAKVKATLLGALFLIDFMYYTKKIREFNEICDVCDCLDCLCLFQKD